jgi:hypothetical protein
MKLGAKCRSGESLSSIMNQEGEPVSGKFLGARRRTKPFEVSKSFWSHAEGHRFPNNGGDPPDGRLQREKRKSRESQHLRRL